MRIIEIMAPCNCALCGGREQLTRMELIADGPEDARQLTELAARLRSEASASGRPITEHHINVNIGEPKPINPEKKAKAKAARNN